MLKIRTLVNFIQKYTYEIAFVIALSATLASLVLSQVLNLPPCTYCWYQRIFMFPLPLVLGAAVLRRDAYSYIFTLPLAFLGMAISAYHSLLQWGIISEGAASTCSLVGPSCGEPEILWLGFLTIPFGAFVSFAAICGLMLIQAKRTERSAIDESAKRPLLLMLTGVALITAVAIAVIRVVGE